MAELKIKWQRLVDDSGQTCNRCSSTGDEVQIAVEMLRQALAPLGITVVAELQELNAAEFQQAPLESNRVWVSDRPLEEWLGADAGQSQCCGPCGDSECRTVAVDEQKYEVIPRELVLKAGLLAAAELVVPSSAKQS